MLKDRGGFRSCSINLVGAYVRIERWSLDSLATTQDSVGGHNRSWSILLIALPHVPFLKSEKEFLSMSFDFEGLYLRYERLWYDFRDSTIDEAAAKVTINELRAKEVEIEKAGVRCPRIQRWIDRVATDVKSVLKLDLV